jgi:hypothetical protein
MEVPPAALRPAGAKDDAPLVRERPSRPFLGKHLSYFIEETTFILIRLGLEIG